MNIKFKYIALFIFAATITACDMGDKYSGDEIKVFDRPTFDITTLEGVKAKEIYDTYGIYVRTDVKPVDMCYDYNTIWTPCNDLSKDQGNRVTPCLQSNILPMLDKIKTQVLDVFPKNFAENYMPINVILADTVGYVKRDPLNPAGYYTCLQYGMCNSNNIILSGCANTYLTTTVRKSYDEIKNTREYSMRLLSLFVERMMRSLPSPVEFIKVNDLASREGNALDIATTPSTFPVISILAMNNNPATLKYLRYGFVMNSRTWNSNGGVFPAPSMNQDFGDYVAFIVYMPETMKATYYAKRFNMNFPNRIKEKEQLVRRYFKENFDITLPYRPISEPTDI